MPTPQENLNAVKALCLEGETPEEHTSHAVELELAYKAFANQRDEDSHPAIPDTVDELLSAHVVVDTEAGL